MKWWSRAMWGARQPRSVAFVDPKRKTHCFLHYTTGEELGVNDCAAWVRNIQAFHLDTKRWADIAYSWLVCKHGDVFEGRGWDKVGGHTQGYNTVGHAICVMGDEDFDHRAALATVRVMFEEADRVSGKALIRLGHKDVSSTSCPGDDLYRWLKAGMPVDGQTPADQLQRDGRGRMAVSGRLWP